MPLNPAEIVGGLAIGEGVGGAISDVVEPQLRDLKNTQSAKHLHVPVPGQVAAEIIARSVTITGFDPTKDAEFRGLSGPRLAALTQLARRYPGVADALTLWRRGYVGWQDVLTWLQFQGMSPATAKHLIGDGSVAPQADNEAGHLFMERLSPAQIALGIVRSIITDPGLMPVNLDTRGGAVPAYPASSINALTEALDSGFNREHLRVLVGEIGLPMSPQQAASALFRALVLPNGKTFARADYYRAILEGDVRPEWADAILEQSRQILTANQYAELELRGFLNEKQRRNHTAKHGMSDTDSDLLFNVLGRSINVHQIVTGEARGGTYKPPPDTLAQQTAGIPPAFLASLQRGNLRPEYYDLAYHNRYTYPSFFAIRGLLTGGVFNADEGYQILLEMGWKPSLARQVADFYGVPATAVKADPLVKAATTSAITETRNAYLIGQADEAQARDWLGRLGVAVTTQDGLVGVWNIMREIPQKGLTAAQIVKAFKKLPAQWPRTRAVDELLLLGLTADDAATLLDE